jgi:hypothetical protein
MPSEPESDLAYIPRRAYYSNPIYAYGHYLHLYFDGHHPTIEGSLWQKLRSGVNWTLNWTEVRSKDDPLLLAMSCDCKHQYLWHKDGESCTLCHCSAFTILRGDK